jgi:hypothetical protein
MGCTIAQATAAVLAFSAVAAWVMAVVAYATLLRQAEGPRSRLVFSSLWLMQPGSLGERAEPVRRRLGRLFLLFMLAVILAIAVAVLASFACQPGSLALADGNRFL